MHLLTPQLNQRTFSPFNISPVLEDSICSVETNLASDSLLR